MNHSQLAALNSVLVVFTGAVVHAQTLTPEAPPATTATQTEVPSAQAELVNAPPTTTTTQAEVPPAQVGQVNAPPNVVGATTNTSLQVPVVPEVPELKKPVVSAPPVLTPAVSKWKLSLYGVAEFNIMRDSTESFPDSGIGATAVARKDTYAGKHGRLHFTTRNSKFGMKVNAPDYEGIKTTAVLEMDFYGNTNGASEGAMMSSGTVRMRLANIKLETDYVDVMVGQTYHLFGWMPYFYPCTSSFFPMPNMAFGRQPQVRLSHTFKTEPINFDLAVAAVRPPQRNSEIPDMQGGLKFGLNGWKGIHSLGAGSAVHDPISIGVSGVVRRFEVPKFASSPPADSSNTATGGGVSVDAFIPVIPAKSVEDRGNALSLTGSYVNGTGIGDLGGFVSAPPYPPTPSDAAGATSSYPAGNTIDSGLVTYGTNGKLHTLNWRGFMAGAQYYLPPSGRVYVAANYTYGRSNNNTRYMNASSADNYSKVYKKSQYVDVNLFVDVIPTVRTGLLYGFYRQTGGDGAVAKNHRAEVSVYCFF